MFFRVKNVGITSYVQVVENIGMTAVPASACLLTLGSLDDATPIWSARLALWLREAACRRRCSF